VRPVQAVSVFTALRGAKRRRHTPGVLEEQIDATQKPGAPRIPAGPALGPYQRSQ